MTERMISYSQNFEDVMIARCFRSQDTGFYIDVGAADPDFLSVTKHFYEIGWRGINIEPLTRFQTGLRQKRSADINLPVFVSTEKGQKTFYEIADLPENSTGIDTLARDLMQSGHEVIEHQVESLSLEEICRTNIGTRPIDFLKIDAEGSELDVLRSADWRTYRPKLLIIEAVEINNYVENWQEWEPFIVNQGYEKVWFDGLNNFYVAHEHRALQDCFRTPPNVFDHFEAADTQQARLLNEELYQEVQTLQHACQERLSLIKTLSEKMKTARELEAGQRAELLRICEERLAVIEHMTREVEAERRAASAERDRLQRILADRLVLIEKLTNGSADSHRLTGAHGP